MAFIGQYEVIAELGEGGMGTATLGRAPDGRLVVLKRPLPGMPELRELLLDEARVGLRLRHEFLVETLDFFELEGAPVLVVAYVSGTSLTALRQSGPVPLEAVCRIGRQIAEALDALHHASDEDGRSLEVVHRDVTPSNIVVGHDGDARLIDLGIAKHVDRTAEKTKTGFLRGTLRYLAPEVFNHGVYSAQSDLWALGVGLLDAALGRLAIEGSEGEIVAKVVYGRVFEPRSNEKLDPRFIRAVQKLLARDPKDRPARGRDAAAVFTMLEKELGDGRAQVSAAVRAAIGEETPFEDEASAAATQMLTGRASAIFCPPTEVDPTVALDRADPSVPPVGLDSAGADAASLLADRPPGDAGLDVSGALEVEQLAEHVSQMGIDPDDVRREIDKELRRYLGMVRGHEVDSGAVPPTPASKDADRKRPDATAEAPAGPAVLRPPSGPVPVPPPVARGRSPTRFVAVGVAVIIFAVSILVLVRTVRGGEVIPSTSPVATSDSKTPTTTPPALAATSPDGAEVAADPEPEEAAASTRRSRKARRGDKRHRRLIVERDPTLEALKKKMPPCWSPGRTRLFYYPDKNGTMVAARRFSDVPKSKRSKVRCAD